jgi:hypothetical protein
VGPNTMATLCTDMRFCSPCSITLGRGGVGSAPRAGSGDGVGRAWVLQPRSTVFPPWEGCPTHLHRCWKSTRSVSRLGAGKVRTRSRTQRLRWAWSCSSAQGKGQRWGPLRVWKGSASVPVLSPFPLPSCSLMATMNWLKCEKGKRGSGSSQKKCFRAPVITWTSSQSPSSRSRRSSAAREGEERTKGRSAPLHHAFRPWDRGWGQASPWSTL